MAEKKEKNLTENVPSYQMTSDHRESVSLRLYIDEIKPAKDRNGNEWMYIGVLAIKDCHHDAVLGILGSADSVLHFDDLREKSECSPKLQNAQQWLNLIAADDSPVCFKLLGISMDRLNKECFGDEQVTSRAYHRFMRSAITALVNGVFHSKLFSHVEILDVYHDRTHHALHWETLPLRKIDEGDSRIGIKCDRIKFLNSDHRADDGHVEHSRMLQLIDVILGSFRYVLDAPEYKRNKGAQRLAKTIHGFVADLNDKKKQGHPKYRLRCGVSYFPKKALATEELFCSDERWKNHFFNTKPLLWNPYGQVQGEFAL